MKDKNIRDILKDYGLGEQMLNDIESQQAMDSIIDIILRRISSYDEKKTKQRASEGMLGEILKYYHYDLILPLRSRLVSEYGNMNIQAAYLLDVIGGEALEELKAVLRRALVNDWFDFSDDELGWNFEKVITITSKYLGEKDLISYLNRFERFEATSYFLFKDDVIVNAVLNGLKSNDQEFLNSVHFLLEKLLKVLGFHLAITHEEYIIDKILGFFYYVYNGPFIGEKGRGEKEVVANLFSKIPRNDKPDIMAGLERFANKEEQYPLTADFSKIVVQIMSDNFGVEF
jgi:hypothetical protein